jgi:NAD(P)-dependent dehydrogenase (short-subunit alcohol dehydrogenase family)
MGLFSLHDRVAIVTGGTGVLGGAITRGLAAAGARVGVLGRRPDRAAQIVEEIEAAGGMAVSLIADVLDKEALFATREKVLARWGRIDILVNAAGGNLPGATIQEDLTFFNLTREAFEQVIALNLTGTLLPCQVFGEVMADTEEGAIINISSMAAKKMLTRVVGYGSAKAAVENFTRWLAVELAIKYGAGLRVNAIAPGFFVGEQNRALLFISEGELSQRGQQIINHTPMGRFGDPEELIGTVVWLASAASRFVTGVVIPVDGGFSAYSGI